MSPSSRRATEETLDAEIAALKARYAAFLRALLTAFDPPLGHGELARGLELQSDGDARRAAARLGRYLSDAPRNRHARPDRATRALIDRIVRGDARICARATATGERELLVCEPFEVARLGADWTVVDVALGRSTRGGAPPVPCPPEDDIDWSGGLSGNHASAPAPTTPGATHPDRGASHARAAAAPARPLVPIPTTPEALVAPPRDEIVMLMGIPAAGKTSAVARFAEAGYVRLNRDLAGGRLDDLLPMLEARFAEGARRFVLDNTYTFRRARAGVIALGASLGLPVRCVHVGGEAADARYNAVLRLFRKLGRLPDPDELKLRGKTDPNTFPPGVIDHYVSGFEPPTEDEGLDRLERLPFIRQDPPDYTQPALLLDLDGTLRTTRSGSPFPTSADDVVLLPRRREVLARWVAAGYRLFGVTNQAGVSLGQVDEASVRAACDRTAALLDLPIEIAHCPHPPGRPVCWCRKPLPGMGVALIERHRLDRRQVMMVGDRAVDEGFARALGVPFVHADRFFAPDAPATPPSDA